MRKSWKFFIGFIFASLVACLIYFYSDPLISHLGRWQVERQCKKTFGTPLSHRGIEFGDGIITIHHPCFTQTIDENQGWNLTAEALLIEGRFLPWQRHHFIDVTIVSPEINVYTTPSGKPCLEWLNLKGSAHAGRWQVQHGEIKVFNSASNEIIRLGVEGSGFLGNVGESRLDFHMLSEDGNKISLIHRCGPDDSTLDFQFEAISLAPFSNLLNRLDPRFCRGWLVEGGTLQGAGSLNLSSGNILPYLSGELRLSDLQLYHLASSTRGSIPTIHIDLQRDRFQSLHQDRERSFLIQLLQGTSGRFDIPEPGHFVAGPGRGSTWALTELTGAVVLDSTDVNLDLEAVVGYGNTSCFFHASGGLSVEQALHGELGLSWLSSAPSDPVSTSHILIHQTQEGEHLLSLDLVNIGQEQTVVLHTIASDLFPDWALVQLSKGKLSARVDLLMHERRIRELRIQQLAADGLVFSIPRWQLEGHLLSAEGGFSANVTDQGQLRKISSNLHLRGGVLEFCGVDGQKRLLSDVSADLAMLRGELQYAQLAAKLDGLEGTLESRRLDGAAGVEIHLRGPVADLRDKLPSGAQSALLRSFGNDNFEAHATLHLHDPYFEIEGLAQVTDPSGATDSLPFGLKMRQKGDLARNPSGLGVWLELALSLAETHLSDPAGQVVVEHGWVRGQNLSANKYALPLIRKPTPTDMQGTVHFEATFDTKLLTVQYEGHNILLDCNAFRVEVPQLGDLSAQAHDFQRSFHFVNLETGEEAGVIPLQGARFFDKHKGLQFEQCSGILSLQPNQLKISEVKANCEGIDIEGEVIVQDLEQGATDVTLHASKMHGDLKGARAILAHVKPSALWEVPLDGQVRIVDEGFHLVLHLDQEQANEAKIEGIIEQASCLLEDGKSSLHNFSAQMVYDHSKRSFGIQKVEGTLCTASSNYRVAGEGLTCQHLPDGEAAFDFSLLHSENEVAHFKGQLTKSAQEGLRAVTFDPKQTHFAGIQPQIRQFLIRGYRLADLHAELGADLAQIAPALHLAYDLGFTQLSSASLEKIFGSEFKGSIDGSLSFEETSGLWTVLVQGHGLELMGRPLGPLKLDILGSSQGWSVKQLKTDHLLTSFAIEPSPYGWSIPFAKVVYEDSVFAEMSGNMDLTHQMFTAQLGSVQIPLDHAQALFPQLENVLERLEASGGLVGRGTLSLDFTQRTPWGCKAAFDGEIELQDVTLCGLAVQPSTRLSCHLLPNGELIMGGLEAALAPTQDAIPDHGTVSASLDQVSCRLGTGSWSLDNLNFVAAHDQIGWLSEAIGSACLNGSGKISVASLKALEHLKREGEIGGSVSIESNQGALALTLRLNEGTYYLGGQPVQVKAAQLLSQGGITRFDAQTTYQGNPLWITTIDDHPLADTKDIFISDRPFDDLADSGPPPLKLSLKRQPDGHFGLDRMLGTVGGVSVDLIRYRHPTVSEGISFLGHLNVDGSRAAAFLPKELAACVCQVGLGEGYQLNGRFQLTGENLSRLNFNGALTGKHFVIKGYQLESLRATVQFTPDAFAIRSLTLKDPAGQIWIDRIQGKRAENEGWVFEIPSIKMTNIQPGLLHAPDQPPRMTKPLVITTLEMTGLRGTQSGLTSWSGKGSLHFTRVLPPSAQVAIPEELRPRLNGDSSRLTPVQGTVHFSIHDSGLYLDKLLNTYSSGKRTQFYLAKGQGPSYIDFNGNLHLKMRVKQRNLILKITEPFTVHIKGSIDKPKWSLRPTKSSHVATR